MKEILKWTGVCGILMLSGAGSVAAQDAESEEPPVMPVEIYVCNYNDGHGPADLDKWAGKWNAWADSSALEPYSAWTLTPFYFGSEQDFDFIWLGISPDAKALGRAYDKYLSQSGQLPAEFDQMAKCEAHNNFATMNIKPPPDNDNSTSFVLSFSNCKHKEGKSFDDVAPALQAWSQYRTAHGSEAGMWVMWPAYGGGDAEFDFKFAVSHPNHESLGADYDQYSGGGYAKAQELFGEVIDCDTARAYNALQRRDGFPDE